MPIAVALFTRGLDDGAHPVVAFAVYLDAVDFALEAGKALAKLLDGEDQLDHRAVRASETLTRHGHGDAGRVGNEHHGGDATRHLGEANLLSLIAEKLLIGLRRCEDRIEVLIASVVDQARQ